MATRMEQLAKRIEDDICKRGLRPGDRYLTAAEVGELLSVSSMMANRAMQTLADQGLLVRQRSRGTFVGPNVKSSSAPDHPFESVHLAISLDHHVASSATLDDLIGSLRRTMSDVAVEIHFLPEQFATRAMKRLVDRLDEKDALILVLSSRAIQSMVEASGVTAVIHGQPYPGIQLNCLQHDQAEIGTQLAKFALSRGHQRFAMLTRGRWRRGDNLMHDALTATLAQNNVGLDEVILRSVIPDDDVILETVQEIMGVPDAPSILICRNDFFASVVMRAVEEQQIEVPEGFEVISGGHQHRGGQYPFARIVSRMSTDEQMDQLVQLLLLAKEGTKGRAVVVPVDLISAGETEAASLSSPTM